MADDIRKLGQDISGAAMDRTVSSRRPKKWRIVGVTLVFAAIVSGYTLWPRGILVGAGNISISTVNDGVFREELLVRASVEALKSVFIDVADGGRVEKIFVADGASVRRGDLLFNLANPVLQQQMLARESEVAQQTSNLGTLKASLQSAKSEYRRRISELSFDYQRAARELVRSRNLASQGFISQAALEDIVERASLQHQLLEDTKVLGEEEIRIKDEVVQRLESMVAQLRRGLSIVRQGVDALNVRATLDGKLTNFNVKEGTILKPGESVGRIDVPGRYKLTATIDEFYLGKLKIGTKGLARIDAHEYDLAVKNVNPQVKEGRFFADLEFGTGAPRELSAGQTVEVRLVLSEPRQALSVADGDFLKDTGGAWAFFLTDDGRTAERRPLRLGKRAAGRIEVLEGAHAGDQIVVSTYVDFMDARKLSIRN